MTSYMSFDVLEYLLKGPKWYKHKRTYNNLESMWNIHPQLKWTKPKGGPNQKVETLPHILTLGMLSRSQKEDQINLGTMVNRVGMASGDLNSLTLPHIITLNMLSHGQKNDETNVGTMVNRVGKSLVDILGSMHSEGGKGTH